MSARQIPKGNSKNPKAVGALSNKDIKEILERFNLKNLHPLKEDGIKVEDCLLDAIEKRLNERKTCIEFTLSEQRNTFYVANWEEAKKFLMKGWPAREKMVSKFSQCKIGCPSGVRCCYYKYLNLD